MKRVQMSSFCAGARPKALIWGESLVGDGHARVQSELAKNLCAAGWEVVCVTGSRARADNFDFGGATMVYQPPLRLKSADSDPYNMTNLLTPAGLTLFNDAAYRRGRRERLLEVYRTHRPQAVITEMWPFARANFDFEVVPLAEAVVGDRRRSVDGAPRLYSIARDVMFPPKLSSPDSPGLRHDRFALVDEFFSQGGVLVRGDPEIIPLEASVGPVPESLRDRIDYVGYFAKPSASEASPVFRPEDGGGVLVTSGGGFTADSRIMFEKAIQARRHSTLRDRLWRVLTPAACPDSVFEELAALALREAPTGAIVVERNRRDFLTLMARAALVICHAGNTVVEAVTSRIPVLVAPRGLSKNNLEQQVRAKAFFDKGLIATATLAEIADPRVLAAKVDHAVGADVARRSVMVDGAARMAQRITDDFLHASRLATLPDAMAG